jgi:hypothetical protein
MDFTGLTDSIPGTPHDHDECPHCCGIVRMHNGVCLGCLVQTGLTADGGAENDNLDVLLSEIE